MARRGNKGRKPKVMTKFCGPSSIDWSKAMKSMDELLGITELAVSNEEGEKDEEIEQLEIGVFLMR